MRRISKERLLAGAALATAMIPFGLGALAVEPESGDPATAVAVDEVLVTARKREEVLRDVPAAVTAITEAQAETLVLDRAEDYLRQLPGATLVTSGPEYLNDITMRGQGGGRLAFSETATGLYRDGMYAAGGGFGGRTLGRMDLFDVDRVEVLRGPQGALLGRNSVGGAINVVANRPDTELGGRLTGRYADPERTDLEAVLNLPLGDRFAVRLGGFVSDQRDGFIHNLDTGQVVDDQSYAGARLTAEARPTGEAVLGLVWERSESEAPSFTSLGQRATRIDGVVLDPSASSRTGMNRRGVSEISEDVLMLRGDFALSWADLSVKAARTERDGARRNEDGDHFNGNTGIDVAPGAARASSARSVERPRIRDVESRRTRRVEGRRQGRLALHLPLIEVARTRARHLERGLPMNFFGHGPRLADHTTRTVTTPNNDTLYSVAHVDLSQGPVSIVLPRTGGRYLSLALMDAYTNNFAVLGTRTTGDDGGYFTIVGPYDAAEGPNVVRSPTPHVWALGRVLVEAPHDLAAARLVQAGITMQGPRVAPPPVVADRHAHWPSTSPPPDG